VEAQQITYGELVLDDEGARVFRHVLNAVFTVPSFSVLGSCSRSVPSSEFVVQGSRFVFAPAIAECAANSAYRDEHARTIMG